MTIKEIFYIFGHKINIESPMNNSIPVSLIQRGTEVFGTEEKFLIWLQKENFFFDKKAPIEFVNTDKGIKFIDDRLTGMQYGDNV
jgi:uncharacterized protein (DUF2384 family)